MAKGHVPLKDLNLQKDCCSFSASTLSLINDAKPGNDHFQQEFKEFSFDETVSAIFHGRRQSAFKYAFYVGSSFASIGIVYLLCRWLPRFKTFMLTNASCLVDATHILVCNSFGQEELLPVKIKRVAKVECKFSAFINSQDSTLTLLDYRCNRFILNQVSGVFMPIEGLLGLCMPSEDEDYFDGLTSEQALEFGLLMGNNEILIEERSALQIFYNEILHPFYIFQVASFFIWLFEYYYLYATIILIIATLSAIMTVFETKRNTDKMRKMARFVCPIKVIRDGELCSASSTSLVPGDVVVLDEHLDVVPFDGMLISGDAILDESMLTGETVPVTKVAFPPESYNNLRDSGFVDQRSSIFSGTKLLRCRSHHGRPPMALVTRTGFLTFKGLLVQSILFPRPNNFRFYRDSMRFIAILGVIAVLGFSVAIINFIMLGVAIYWIVSRALDVITVVVPPALPATMAVGTVFAIKRLERAQIYCISPPRINIASKIQTMCFDKTGTLTEEGLEILGVIQVQNDDHVRFGKLAGHAKGTSQQTEMVRLMATCHGLGKINGRLLGDSLDLRMFEFTQWELEEFTDVGEAIVPTIVRPDRQSSVKGHISSEMIVDNQYFSRGEIGIIRTFDFDSKLRRMSVIVRCLDDDDMFIYAKGSPESMREICRLDTLPDDYNEVFARYAHEGYRVIGCAYKLREDLTWIKAQKLDREEAERDMCFLGFIIFENRLKAETGPTIAVLKNAGITNIMATGDNILTAISVGRASGMIDENSIIFYPSSFFEATSSREVIWSCVDDADLSFDSVRLKPIMRDGHNGKDYVFAVNGDFLDWMLECMPTEYRDRIFAHSRIYARMSPQQKQLLVETLQQKSVIVGFCGDGANDCGALKAADVGISLSQAEASIAAPFTSKIQDISCVPALLKEGRASLVTSFCCFKYMTLYSMIQFTTLIFLYSFGSTLSDGQFVYVDLLLIVPLGILMSRYSPAKHLVSQQPTAKLISPMMLTCILGHIAIQAVAQASVYFLFARPLTIDWKPIIIDESQTTHPSTTLMFMFSTFLYIGTALIFSVGAPYRQTFYWPFALYALLALLATIFIIFARTKWLDSWLSLVEIDIKTRLILFLSAITYFVCAVSFDRFLVPRLAREIHKRLKATT